MWNSKTTSAGVLERAVQDEEFLADVLSGLRREPPRLPCKYFYDRRGSLLFDKICRLDEYYPTRTELAIMERFGAEMAAACGERVMLIEYGSGSSVKTRTLLAHLDSPAAYVPVDISGKHLLRTAKILARDYPQLKILPVCADFVNEFDLPDLSGESARRVIYFPGSTIGNFTTLAASNLLRQMHAQCGPGGKLLIGVDLKKEVAVLEAAYNDREGVTAAFNLNLLARINRELGGNFRLRRFRHEARYDLTLDRIEMYLVSSCRQTVQIGGERFWFGLGDRICTEYSHKYTVDGFAAMAAASGWRLETAWTDPQSYFAVLHLAADDL